jgi:precorrin-6A/cobalt-precorrin-6A reductase
MRVLVLGGTGEARALAASLQEVPGVQVTSSLAGRLSDVRLPVGDVRIGGFGGAPGLADWLRNADAVIDATHPFAARITANAVGAARDTGTPLLVLRRPAWEATPADDWREVADLDTAAETLADLGECVFLTIGRQGVAAFAGLDRHWFLVRCIEPPSPPTPRWHELVLDRGPFTLAGELELIRRHAIDVMVTKNSGGAMTAAKLEAAREIGLPVVMVRRPAVPGGVRVVAAVDDAVRWVEDQRDDR